VGLPQLSDGNIGVRAGGPHQLTGFDRRVTSAHFHWRTERESCTVKSCTPPSLVTKPRWRLVAGLAGWVLLSPPPMAAIKLMPPIEKVPIRGSRMDLLGYAFDALHEEVELVVGRVRTSSRCLDGSGQRYVRGDAALATRGAIGAKCS
jgi:hypothetical protein